MDDPRPLCPNGIKPVSNSCLGPHARSPLPTPSRVERAEVPVTVTVPFLPSSLQPIAPCLDSITPTPTATQRPNLASNCSKRIVFKSLTPTTTATPLHVLDCCHSLFLLDSLPRNRWLCARFVAETRPVEGERLLQAMTNNPGRWGLSRCKDLLSVGTRPGCWTLQASKYPALTRRQYQRIPRSFSTTRTRQLRESNTAHYGTTQSKRDQVCIPRILRICRRIGSMATPYVTSFQDFSTLSSTRIHKNPQVIQNA